MIQPCHRSIYLLVTLLDSFLSEIFQQQNDMHKNRPKQVNEKIPERLIFYIFLMIMKLPPSQVIAIEVVAMFMFCTSIRVPSSCNFLPSIYVQKSCLYWIHTNLHTQYLELWGLLVPKHSLTLMLYSCTVSPISQMCFTEIHVITVSVHYFDHQRHNERSFIL